MWLRRESRKVVSEKEMKWMDAIWVVKFGVES
jgi:hypothetical protein